DCKVERWQHVRAAYLRCRAHLREHAVQSRQWAGRKRSERWRGRRERERGRGWGCWRRRRLRERCGRSSRGNGWGGGGRRWRRQGRQLSVEVEVPLPLTAYVLRTGSAGLRHRKVLLTGAAPKPHVHPQDEKRAAKIEANATQPALP